MNLQKKIPPPKKNPLQNEKSLKITKKNAKKCKKTSENTHLPQNNIV